MGYIKVLIMDSGVGGLSIAKHIRELNLGVSITYLADRAFFPYGNKPPTELTTRVAAVASKAIEKVNPDIVVLACNTASTTALAILRQAFSIPFVGVVPAIKPACYQSATKKIGILATAGTAATDYLKQLIKEFALECEVVTFGSARLALLAEDKLQGKYVDPYAVREEILPLFEGPYGLDIDSIVLACTHFPLLQPELQAASPRPVKWIDSGEAIARRVQYLIGAAADVRLADTPGKPTITRFLNTDSDNSYDTDAVTALLGRFNTEFIQI